MTTIKATIEMATMMITKMNMTMIMIMTTAMTTTRPPITTTTMMLAIVDSDNDIDER